MDLLKNAESIVSVETIVYCWCGLLNQVLLHSYLDSFLLQRKDTTFISHRFEILVLISVQLAFLHQVTVF